MTIKDIQAFLDHNGLGEMIAKLHDAAPKSFGAGDAEAFARMKLILRVLDLPAASASDLLRTIEKFTTDEEPL
ncbi:hypothetical protein HNQ96_005073 [Aminobacter lissarensis]|uniref:Uncharacterized protein n=1 Tax=Aminobacter carboxidus TaxID=376165 RepID=A0A8E1WJT9_9HYPH|nr:hypothetical protein [Aminobacter lissarensis]MBB6469184.1 hypothetical protein [Aminobacter lissarensis]